MTASTLRVVEDFGDRLAAVHDPARRRRAPALIAVAGLLVAIASALVTLGSGRTSPALAIERSGAFVSIRLQDASADPSELTRQLQAAGFKAHVLVAPATPDAVGTWVEVQSPRVLPRGADPAVHDAFDETAEARLAAERLKGVQVRDDVVRVPAGYDHELTLIAGVAPREGQVPLYDAHGRLDASIGGVAGR
jgi:hypothetical protein